MSNKTKLELEACVDRLLKSGKPKMIVGTFIDRDIQLLSDEKFRHFKTAEYLWQATPLKKDPHKGLHLGVLLDEELKYVHMVVASTAFMLYTFSIR
jgi:hypothetical protein